MEHTKSAARLEVVAWRRLATRWSPFRLPLSLLSSPLSPSLCSGDQRRGPSALRCLAALQAPPLRIRRRPGALPRVHPKL